jgi:hypothetical protein
VSPNFSGVLELQSELIIMMVAPFGSPIRQDYPPNLSILISGGKETNKDSLSKGD